MKHFTCSIVLLATCIGTHLSVADDRPIKLPSKDKFHLFILAGQSNMAGRGRVAEQDREPHPRVLMLNKEGQWVPAIDPLHFDKPNIVGVGLGRTFGIQVAEADPDITVGLIPCAVGGSPISSWEPRGYHASTKTHPYDDAVQRIRLALKSGTLKGILWHQGESDSKPELADVYEEKLHALIARFRKEFDALNVPFIAGQMGRFAERPWSDAKKLVDAAHRSLPDKVTHTAFVSSQGLNHKGDEVHFDAASCRELGRRYAKAYLQTSETTATSAERPPNFVVVFCDDMGYADIGPFGAEGYSTPHLDRMAREGMKFTDFYVGRSFCTPSRAALMTGCIPTRVGIGGNFGPHSKTGLNPDEMTIAEVLKEKGYATACFGKWHLGHMPKFLPTNQGFDVYFGIPYSNDMWPFHPNVRHLPMEERLKRWPHLPLYEGTEVVNPQVMPADQVHFTTKFADRAVEFIEKHADEPFFIYLPNPQPHVPLFVSEKFTNETKRGLFGDVIGEIDWGVGQIMAALEKHGIDENTCIVFSSDNGPWLLYGDHAGSAKPLREGKGTNFEGGFRVPCLMRWPGKIRAGKTCREVAGTIDLLPTFAKLADAPLPKNKIDGKNISALMFGKEGAQSPHDVFYHYDGGNRLMAVRSGKWKLMFPQTYGSPIPGEGGLPGKGQRKSIELSLFDLENDIGETTNVAEQHPDVVERLKEHAEAMRAELGDGNENVGKARRPIGR